jgi:hypothetical protein
MNTTRAAPEPSTFLDHLSAAVRELDGMRAAAVSEGCPMLALTLQLARDEAADEIARRSAKRKTVRQLPSNVIRFPRKRLAKRRNSNALADCGEISIGQVLRFAARRGR